MRCSVLFIGQFPHLENSITQYLSRRSIIPACDVDVSSLTHLARIADGTAYVEGIGAYKIGLDLVIRFGLAQPIRIIREYSRTTPIIYDHQKAGNDIPAMGKQFADAVNPRW